MCDFEKLQELLSRIENKQDQFNLKQEAWNIGQEIEIRKSNKVLLLYLPYLLFNLKFYIFKHL